MPPYLTLYLHCGNHASSSYSPPTSPDLSTSPVTRPTLFSVLLICPSNMTHSSLPSPFVSPVLFSCDFSLSSYFPYLLFSYGSLLKTIYLSFFSYLILFAILGLYKLHESAYFVVCLTKEIKIKV